MTTAAERAFGLDFDYGTAYATFGDPAKLDLAKFTIETWFKRTALVYQYNRHQRGYRCHSSGHPRLPQDDGSNIDANWVLVIDDTTDVIAADFEDMATGLNHPVFGTTPIAQHLVPRGRHL